MIIVAVRELVFRSKISAAAERLGVTVRLAPRSAALQDLVGEADGGIFIVDLTPAGILDEVRAAKRAGAGRIVGFLGHLQTELMHEASLAGADEVLSRGEFVKRIDDILRAG